jgi:hypothetical protein
MLPVTQPLEIQFASTRGRAVALAFDGNTMFYLVAIRGTGAPAWFAESEVEQAFVS